MTKQTVAFCSCSAKVPTAVWAKCSGHYCMVHMSASEVSGAVHSQVFRQNHKCNCICSCSAASVASLLFSWALQKELCSLAGQPFTENSSDGVAVSTSGVSEWVSKGRCRWLQAECFSYTRTVLQDVGDGVGVVVVSLVVLLLLLLQIVVVVVKR